MGELSNSFATETPPIEIAVRLVAACLLAGLIGVDREIRHRTAGLRTHMMAALAAAAFTVLALELSAEGGDGIADPIRAVQAVAAGVAFLAAGAIIRGREEVRGLTTGVGLWLAGAIGLACGAGEISVAILATALAIVILAPLRSLEAKLRDRDQPPAKP